MANKVTVGIRLQADGVGRFTAANRTAQSSLERTRKSALSAGKSVDVFSGTVDRANGVLRTFLGVGLATGFVAISKGAVTSADQFRVLEARVRVATLATGDYNEVSRELFAISQRNGASLRETIKLFQNLSRVAPELDANNQQMIELLDLVQQVGVTSGASFDDMKFAMRQFAQSMASGIVRAEEFNSIVENVPELAFQIAKGMGTTVGQLRLAVVEGRVLSKEVFEAINKQGDEINLIFRGFPRSIEQSTTALQAGLGKALSNLNNELSYGTDEFVDTLDSLAESLAAFAEDEEAIANVARSIENLTAAGKLAIETFLYFKAGGLAVGGFNALRSRIGDVRKEILALNGAAVTASTSLKTATIFTPIGRRAAPGLGAFGGAGRPDYPRGFGVLTSQAQAAPVNKLTTAVKGLGAASAAAIGVLGGWPVVLTAAGLAAASFAISAATAKDETEDFEKTLLSLEGSVTKLKLRQLNSNLAEYELRLKEATDEQERFTGRVRGGVAAQERQRQKYAESGKQVETLTAIVARYREEIKAVTEASAELTSRAGLDANTEYTAAFLEQLGKILEAQQKVGKSKRELDLLAIDGLKISKEEADRLKAETNALYDKVDANERLLESQKKAESQAKQQVEQARQFSESLDKQIESIKQSTIALSLEGRELEIHNALMQNGLLTRRNLTAADEARKQTIIAVTNALYDQKDAITQLNTSLDRELKQLSQVEELRKSLRTPEESENEAFESRKQLIFSAVDDGNLSQDKAAELLQREEQRNLDAMAKIAEDRVKQSTDTMSEFVKEAARNMQDAMADGFFNVMQGNFSDLEGNFKATIDRMVANLLASQLMNFAFGADFGETGKVGGFIGDIAGKLFSFDGGGFTGTGARVGGIDGKGGFLSVVHPNESIIDHTKGQRMQGGQNNVFNINVGTVRDSREAAQIGRTIGQEAGRAMAAGQRHFKRNY